MAHPSWVGWKWKYARGNAPYSNLPPTLSALQHSPEQAGEVTALLLDGLEPGSHVLKGVAHAGCSRIHAVGLGLFEYHMEMEHQQTPQFLPGQIVGDGTQLLLVMQNSFNHPRGGQVDVAQLGQAGDFQINGAQFLGEIFKGSHRVHPQQTGWSLAWRQARYG